MCNFNGMCGRYHHTCYRYPCCSMHIHGGGGQECRKIQCCNCQAKDQLEDIPDTNDQDQNDEDKSNKLKSGDSKEDNGKGAAVAAAAAVNVAKNAKPTQIFLSAKKTNGIGSTNNNSNNSSSNNKSDTSIHTKKEKKLTSLRFTSQSNKLGKNVGNSVKYKEQENINDKPKDLKPDQNKDNENGKTNDLNVDQDKENGLQADQDKAEENGWQVDQDNENSQSKSLKEEEEDMENNLKVDQDKNMENENSKSNDLKAKKTNSGQIKNAATKKTNALGTAKTNSNSSIHAKRCSAASSRNTTPTTSPRLSAQSNGPRKSVTPSNSARNSKQNNEIRDKSKGNEAAKKTTGIGATNNKSSTSIYTKKFSAATPTSSPRLSAQTEKSRQSVTPLDSQRNSLKNLKKTSLPTASEKELEEEKENLIKEMPNKFQPVENSQPKEQEISTTSTQTSHTKSPADKEITNKVLSLTKELETQENNETPPIENETLGKKSFTESINRVNKGNQTASGLIQSGREPDVVPFKQTSYAKDKNDQQKSDLKQLGLNQSVRDTESVPFKRTSYSSNSRVKDDKDISSRRRDSKQLSRLNSVVPYSSNAKDKENKDKLIRDTDFASFKRIPYSNNARKDKDDKGKSSSRRDQAVYPKGDSGKKTAITDADERSFSICSCYQSTRTLYRAKGQEKSQSPYRRTSTAETTAKDEEKSLVKIKPKPSRRKRFPIRPRTTAKMCPKAPASEMLSGMHGTANDNNIWFECNMPIRVNIPTSICMQNLFGFSPFSATSSVDPVATKCLVKAPGPKFCISLGPAINSPPQLPQIEENHQQAKPAKRKGKPNKKRRKSLPSSGNCPCEISTQTTPSPNLITTTPESEPAPPDYSSVIFSQCKLLQNCVELITKQLAISEERRRLVDDEKSCNVSKKKVKAKSKRDDRRKADDETEIDDSSEDSSDYDETESVGQTTTTRFQTCRSNFKCIHKRDTRRVSIGAQNSNEKSLSFASSQKFPDVPQNSLVSGLSNGLSITDKMLPHQECLYVDCPNHYKIKEMPETLVPRNSLASAHKRDAHQEEMKNRAPQAVRGEAAGDQWRHDSDSQRCVPCHPSNRTIRPVLPLPYPDNQQQWRPASYSQTKQQQPPLSTQQKPPIQHFQSEEWKKRCRKCCLRTFNQTESTDTTLEGYEPSIGSVQRTKNAEKAPQTHNETNILNSQARRTSNDQEILKPNRQTTQKLSENQLFLRPPTTPSRSSRKSDEMSNKTISGQLSFVKSFEQNNSQNERQNTEKPFESEQVIQYSSPNVQPESNSNQIIQSKLKTSQRQSSKEFLQPPLEITSPEELLGSMPKSVSLAIAKMNNERQKDIRYFGVKDPIRQPLWDREIWEEKCRQCCESSSITKMENSVKDTLNCWSCCIDNNIRIGRRNANKEAAERSREEVRDNKFNWANGGEEDRESEEINEEIQSNVNIDYLGPSQDFALCDYANSRKQQLNLKLLRQIINESSIERKIHPDCLRRDQTRKKKDKASFVDNKAQGKQLGKKPKSTSTPLKKKLCPGSRSQSAPASSRRRKPCQCLKEGGKERRFNPFLLRQTKSDIIAACTSRRKSKKKANLLTLDNAKNSQHFRCGPPASPSSAIKKRLPQSEDKCECNCNCNFDCNIDCIEPTMDAILEQYELAGYQRCFPTLHPPQKGGTEILAATHSDKQQLGTLSAAESRQIEQQPLVQVSFRLDNQSSGKMMAISQPDKWIEFPARDTATVTQSSNQAEIKPHSSCRIKDSERPGTSRSLRQRHNAEIPPPSQVVSPRSKTKCKEKNMQQLYRDMVQNKETVMLMHPRRLRSEGSVQSATIATPHRQLEQRWQLSPGSQQSSHSTFSSTSSTISRQRNGMGHGLQEKSLLIETTCTCDMEQLFQTLDNSPRSQYAGRSMDNHQQQVLQQQQQLWEQQQLIQHQRHLIEQYQRPTHSGQGFAGFPEQNNNHIDYISECTNCNCWVDPRRPNGHFQSAQSMAQDYQPYGNMYHHLDNKVNAIAPTFYQGTNMAKYGNERIDANFRHPHISIECFQPQQQQQQPRVQPTILNNPCVFLGQPFQLQQPQAQPQPQPQLGSYNFPQPVYKHFNNTYTESSTI